MTLAQEGRTMILVTHEMQFAQAIADRDYLPRPRENR